jgi:lipoyl synthase
MPLAYSVKAYKFQADLPARGIRSGARRNSAEIRETLQDLHQAGCRYLTIGQYLQPSETHLPVDRFVNPEEFLE